MTHCIGLCVTQFGNPDWVALFEIEKWVSYQRKWSLIDVTLLTAYTIILYRTLSVIYILISIFQAFLFL